MEFMDYIVEEMLVLIPVLYIIGMIIKRTPKISDWLIPYIVLFLGILLAFGIGGVSVKSLIQGILVAGATVLSNQLIKQTIEKDS